MRAVSAWSANELGGKPTPVDTLFGFVSPDGAVRTDAGLFEHTLKNMIRDDKEAGSPMKPRDVERTIDAEDTTAAPVQAPVSPDRNRSPDNTSRVRNEIVRMASAEASDPTPKSGRSFGGNSVETVAIQGKGEQPASVLGTGFPQSGRSSGGNSVETVAIQGKGEQPASVLGTGFPISGLVEEVLKEEATVLPAPINAQESGKSMNASLPREIPRVGQSGFGDMLPGGESLTQQAVELLSADTFSGFRMTISAEDEAFLNGDVLNRGHTGNLLDSATMVPVRTPFDGGILPGFVDHTVQPAATHAVGVEFENLLDQFIQGARLAQRAGATEIHVRLKPDFLGKLSIRALADEYGIRIEIKAESEIVRQIMQDNLADLQQRLAEKGFASNQLSILADTGWTHQRGRGEMPSGAPTRAPEATTETATEVAVEAMPPTEDGRINYLA